jgi:predicted nucleic-acid-binding protein
MIAVDTNIVIRLLTNDDHEQAGRAIALFESGPVFIPKTVVLETEWVLRYAYGISGKTIVEAFAKLFGLPNVYVEDIQLVLRAVALHEVGLDFADALHVESSANAKQFATFDQRLIRKAAGHCPIDVVCP